MKSNTGLKNYLRGHGYQNQTEGITNDASGEGVSPTRVRCANYHVCTYVYKKIQNH